ncbi:MerR family transcriptional regulator [Neobacillus cucumis]|uniref:MerR family transcriptional regulator n=1 Tax=Neobacillus cucumis TaxID=1740721 RepID=UPI002559BF20|nr:MerR family transcriptional regulator [Neobacillus cucumis]
MFYSMKHIVENFNVSGNTLRFYENEGILKDIARDDNGRRIYNDENIEWIKLIRSLRLTGMPISKIKEYVELYEIGDKTFFERKEIMKQHKLEVQNKINENLKHLEVISYKVAMYELQEKGITEKI